MIDWPSQYRDSHQGMTAHGINITDGVGRGDPSEIKWIVQDGHEKVRRADQRSPVPEINHRGIIPKGIPDQQTRIIWFRFISSQDTVEDGRIDLASAS